MSVIAEAHNMQDLYSVWFYVMQTRQELHKQLRELDYEAFENYPPTESADRKLGTEDYLTLLQKAETDIKGMRADIAAANARVVPEPDYAAINKILAELEIKVPPMQLSVNLNAVEELPPTTWWRALLGIKR